MLLKLSRDPTHTSLDSQSQVSLLEQKLEERSLELSDLQRQADRFYQAEANASRQVDSLNESQRLAESAKSRTEQRLKETELENIRCYMLSEL